MTQGLMWERQAGESDPAWGAFQRYLEAGDARTAVALAHQGVARPHVLARWCRRYRWALRALAWDEDQDRVVREEHMAELRRLDMQIDAIAKAMLGRVAERLRQLSEKQIETMSAADVARLFNEAVRVLRQPRFT